MLETIRDRMKGAFATIVVVFISAIFALWGVESLFNRQASQPAVATVDGKDITEAEVVAGVNNLRQRYMQMFNGQIDPAMLSDQMLRGPAIEQLISRRVLSREADVMKLSIGQATIDRHIVSDPAFSQDGKTFDPEHFKAVLRGAGLTAVGYNQQLADSLRLEHLQQAVIGSAFVTERQILDFARLQSQQRSFSRFTLPLEGAAQAMPVDEQAVADYYQAQQERFMSEETVRLEYLELNRDALAATIDVDMADIKAKYEQEKAAAVQATERQAAHILVADEAQAKQLKTELDNGADFAALAKQHSTDVGSAESGGDVGYSAGNVFVQEFEQALADLTEIGQVSEPVKTEFGYHIVKLLNKREAKVPEFAEREAALRSELQQEKAAELYSERMEQLIDQTYSAGDLAGPAQELGLALQQVPAFGRRGGAGIASQQSVIDAAFSDELIDGSRNSQVIELSPSRAVVLRVAGHKPATLKPLADVKADIVATLQREAAESALQQRAEQLLEQLRRGDSLDTVGAQEKLTADSGKISRNDSSVSPAVANALFALPRPQPGEASVALVAEDNGDRVVLVLNQVEELSVAVGDDAFRAAEQTLAEQAGRGDYQRFEQAARLAAKVKLQQQAAPASAP